MDQALLFDLDGVLLNTERRNYEIWRDYLLEAEHYELKPEHYAAVCGASPDRFEAMMDSLPGGAEKLRQAWIREVEEQIGRGEIPRIPGFDALFAYLKACPKKKAVVTSNGGPWVEAYARHCRFYEIFDEIFCGYLVEHRKPAPDLYLLACRELGVTPERCIAVEDSQWGALAAQRAGIPVLHMVGIPELSREISEKCLGHVRDLNEAVAFFRQRDQEGEQNHEL